MSFFNLSLLLERKDQVSEFFKNFVSNLTYDLNVYKYTFDSLDAEFACESVEVKKSLQQAISMRRGRIFQFFRRKNARAGKYSERIQQIRTRGSWLLFQDPALGYYNGCPFHGTDKSEASRLCRRFRNDEHDIRQRLQG